MRPHLNKWKARWFKRLSKLLIIIKCKPGLLQVVPDTLSRRPVRTPAYLSSEDSALITKWLCSNAPQHALADCLQAAVDAPSANREMAFLKYKYCSAAHLDSGTWAVHMHTTHICSSCGKYWEGTAHIQGNPLAMLQPTLYGKRLVLVKAPGKLALLILEPSWLASVYDGQRNSQDQAVTKLLEAAQACFSTFMIWQVHGFDLLYRQTDDLLQLVIPNYKVFDSCF